MTTKKSAIKKEQAIRELWKRGALDYKRHSNQEIIRDFIKNNKADIITILASRRQGKSYELLIQAVELCLEKKDAIVKYICPRLKMVSTIVHPNMKTIIKDCPANMRPEWKENAKMYIFPNGSQIQFAGTDNGSHENIRGGAADLCIVDEAGFCDHLGYVINDILAPTTDTTGGKVILISTPSTSSQHEFILKFVKPAMASGNFLKLTIHDNPMLSNEKKAAIAARFPLGVEDPGYQREYLCEIINDKEAVVIPEFNEKRKELLVKVLEKPPYFDPYVSGDVGFKDLTVYLFAYWDFMKARLVIEDELVMNGPEMTTETLAAKIKEKEQYHFIDGVGDAVPVYMRVMDNNLIMVNDLQRLHGLNFLATAKDNKEAQINQLRMMIANDQIFINPRCKHLIYHLENASWDKHHKAFTRLPNSGDHAIKGGHADACFPPGSKVLTKKGMKNIEDIKPGEYVLTHKGRFKKVLNVMNKEYSGKLKSIKVSGRNKIKCTPDHAFYSADSYKSRDEGLTGQKKTLKPEWRSAESLIPLKHYAYVPSIKESEYEITNESNHKRIRSIKEEDYAGLVYNLEVEDDNSYTVEGVAVHNCDALIYLVRNLVRSHNPYPKGWQAPDVNSMHVPRHKKDDSAITQTLKKILNLKR